MGECRHASTLTIKRAKTTDMLFKHSYGHSLLQRFGRRVRRRHAGREDWSTSHDLVRLLWCLYWYPGHGYRRDVRLYETKPGCCPRKHCRI